MKSLLTTLPALLPVAYAFAERHEAIILEIGEALDAAQIADARRAGVAQPENIRVLEVTTLPEPSNQDALFAARRSGLFQPESRGMAVGWGIYLCEAARGDRQVLLHECVHVAQYERMGGIRPFLDIYLRECIDPGYPFGGLEQEAILVSRDICKRRAGQIVAG
ncbi:MAG: hypothetical protein WDO13_20175 [Verrucomicrobiota bacterium]